MSRNPPIPSAPAPGTCRASPADGHRRCHGARAEPRREERQTMRRVPMLFLRRGRAPRRLRGAAPGAGGLRHADPDDRLPEGGQAAPRQALRGLPLLLQLALPAQARLLRGRGPRGHARRRSTTPRGCSSMDPTRLFTDAQSTEEWRKKKFFSVTEQHGGGRVERLPHDRAALPQDEEPEERRRVPAGGGRPDLRRGPERAGGLPGEAPEPRHALRLPGAQAGGVRPPGRLAGPGRARAHRRRAGAAHLAAGRRRAGHRASGRPSSTGTTPSTP